MASENSTKQANRGTFAPGRSGNPKGRPRTPDDVKAIFASPKNRADVASALLATALDRRHRDHARAAIAFLERSEGRVPQKHELEGSLRLIPVEVASLSDDELVRRAQEALARRQAAGELPVSTEASHVDA